MFSISLQAISKKLKYSGLCHYSKQLVDLTFLMDFFYRKKINKTKSEWIKFV